MNHFDETCVPVRIGMDKLGSERFAAHNWPRSPCCDCVSVRILLLPGHPSMKRIDPKSWQLRFHLYFDHINAEAKSYLSYILGLMHSSDAVPVRFGAAQYSLALRTAGRSEHGDKAGPATGAGRAGSAPKDALCGESFSPHELLQQYDIVRQENCHEPT